MCCAEFWGGIHVGQETSADTQYFGWVVTEDFMEVRGAELPSGLGKVGFPIKVSRNRKRKPGQSYSPQFAWKKDLWDTAGLETWISKILRAPR